MASTLPDSPSLDRLRKDARTLQRAVAARTPDAVSLVRRWHPAPGQALDTGRSFALHDAQLTVARRYGFSGWPALAAYLRTAAEITRTPGAVDDDALDPADRFCALACLRYLETDSPVRWQEAADLLAHFPGLLDGSVFAAAAAMDAAALRRHVAHDPVSAVRQGGPFRWPPLLYLCYSRLPVERTETEVLDAAGLLLDAGADPDSGYLWGGLASPFTALTGAFGEGEQGARRQPPHPHSRGLAQALLDRGADPNDSQTLYNRMFSPADDHLELLFAHGLGRATGGAWSRRLGEAMETPEQMLARQVRWAADHGFVDRLSLLAAHGVDVSGVAVTAWRVPEDVSALVGGRTALHEAAWAGDLERIRLLLAAGADPAVVDEAYGTTALGWAEHAYQTEAADLLRPLTL